MNHTIESLLDHPTISNGRRFLSEYQFHLGTLTPIVTIRLYENLNNGRVDFEQSHYIKPPKHGGPYMTNANSGDDEYDALRRALNTLTTNYDGAVRSEEEPNDSWLVPNEHWGS